MVKKNIMIVDDEPDVTYAIKVGLERIDSNYKVVCADSGKQCLQILKNKKSPDLILLDIMMPEMSGWATFHELKRNASWEKIPVVFLTARRDRIAKDVGIRLGDDYIEKPVEITALKERIDKVLNTGRSKKASTK